MRIGVKRLGVLVLVLLFGGVGALADEAGKRELAYRKAAALWKRDRKRPPLQLRYNAMRALAESRHPKARDILIKRYAKPRDPKDHERYLIASLLGEHYREEADVEPLRALAAKHRRDGDAWLAFHVLGSLHAAGRAESVRATALDVKAKRFERAAALEALSRAKDAAALETLRATLEGLDRARPFDRALLLESGASILYAMREQAKEKVYQEAAEALLEQLRAEDVTDRTRLVVARRLGRAFGIERLALDPLFWQQVVQHQKEVDTAAHTIARPRFGGIEASGTRIAYLLDMSDSMTMSVSAAARAIAGHQIRRPSRQRQAVSGGRASSLRISAHAARPMADPTRPKQYHDRSHWLSHSPDAR